MTVTDFANDHTVVATFGPFKDVEEALRWARNEGRMGSLPDGLYWEAYNLHGASSKDFFANMVEMGFEL